MSWANKVLPVFIAASRPKAGRLHQIFVQIDTTFYYAGDQENHGL
jgi:hypothetical protein